MAYQVIEMSGWGKHRLNQFKGKTKGEKLRSMSQHIKRRHRKENAAAISKGLKKAHRLGKFKENEDLTNPLLQRILLSLARAVARRAGVELRKAGTKKISRNLSDRELAATRSIIRSALREVEKDI